MFNKVNSKYLIIAFVVLLAIVVIVLPAKNNKKARSFKSDLSSFDTAKVTSINIYPKAKEGLISLEKKNNKWQITDSEGTFNADQSQVSNILATLSDLNAKRLVARGKDKWKAYELTDSLGVRVQIKGGKKTFSDVYIGKFDYKQAPQSGNPYMQRQQQGILTSFVRLTGEKEVYAVDGFLSMSFNRSASDFRDRTILKTNKNEINRITSNSFDLIKQDNKWMLDGLIADSALVANFISEISHLNGNAFLTNAPQGDATNTLSIESGENKTPIKISAYVSDSANIAITSSLNKGAYFDGTKNDLYKKLFKDKEEFLE